MAKFYQEAASSVPIYEECDVLVVGGGAAGHSAAIAAARAGCKNVVLMERYGYFGGDVTGGYVIMVPAMNWRNFSMVRGLQEEWFTRLDKSCPEAYICPSLDEIGDTNQIKVDRWNLIHGCTSRSAPQHLVRAPYYEPNQLKIEMDLMVQEEPNVHVLLHSWGTKPIMDGDVCKGVIFESKEGRKAVLAKVVIDATGDGDLYCQTGAPYFSYNKLDEFARAQNTALVWRMGGVDYEAFVRWYTDKDCKAAFNDAMSKAAGYRTFILPSERNDVIWFNNYISDRDCANIEDLKYTEFTVRNSIRKIIEFCKEYMPTAFRNAFLYDIAPQLGSRCSRRLDGEYVMSQLDYAVNRQFDDVIAWHSVLGMVNEAPIELPYRCILPKKVENLLCPGRHLSADAIAINNINLIPQCVGTGQAAGVAAAVCVAEGTTTHNVNIKRVQDILCMEQDVPLPRQANTDPELVRQLEENKYGTMAPNAKKIRAAAGLDW